MSKNIDQILGKNIEKTDRHYRVRYRANNKLRQRNFNFEKYGGEENALNAATQYRDKIMGNAKYVPTVFDWLARFLMENDINSPKLTQNEIYEEIKLHFLNDDSFL